MNNLLQDTVFFLEDGVKDALEVLWNEADESGMSIEELQNLNVTQQKIEFNFINVPSLHRT